MKTTWTKQRIAKRFEEAIVTLKKITAGLFAGVSLRVA